MARRKNQPESVKVKCHLSERLRQIRVELFGERGGSEMARRLGLPIRTWYNYEGGVTVPAEVLLRFVELTSVEPTWLLHGTGIRYRANAPAAELDGPTTVQALLRRALEHLERRPLSGEGDSAEAGEGPTGDSLQPSDPLPNSVRVEGDAMAPIVADGARVVFAEEDEALELLDGKLVVARVEGRSLVRWFSRSGQFGLLRAENPAHEPATILIDFAVRDPRRSIRRVLWINTPH